MSLGRLVYYSALIGGWAAFIGWLLAETVIIRGNANDTSFFALVMIGAVVGSVLGLGLFMVAGFTNASWRALSRRGLVGLAAGAVAGALGILLGNALFVNGLPRALGFTVLGLGIGIAEGVYERSGVKMRNGAIGGLLGGFIGGLLFDPLTYLLQSESGLASRATAFVILGLFVGLLIGFVQVILRDASLKIIDGTGVGRMLLISKPLITIGRSDVTDLPLIGPKNQDLKPRHAQISRDSNGAYRISAFDENDEIFVRPDGGNYVGVKGTQILNNGDTIRVGINHLLFEMKKRRTSQQVRQTVSTNSPASQSSQSSATKGTKQAPPPPPPTKSADRRTPDVSTGKKQTPQPSPKKTGPPPQSSTKKTGPPPPPPPSRK